MVNRVRLAVKRPRRTSKHYNPRKLVYGLQTEANLLCKHINFVFCQIWQQCYGYMYMIWMYIKTSTDLFLPQKHSSYRSHILKGDLHESSPTNSQHTERAEILHSENCWCSHSLKVHKACSNLKTREISVFYGILQNCAWMCEMQTSY